MRKKRLKFLFVFFTFFLFVGCTSLKQKDVLDFSYIENSDKNFEWEILQEGIYISHLEYKDYPLILHAVKIDLSCPGIKVVVTEPFMFKPDFSVKRETVLSFAKRNNTLISVNAAFFDTKSLLFSSTAKPLGLHIHNGEILSCPNEKYGAVYFLNDGTAIIENSQSMETIPKNTVYAVSGFKMILKDSIPIKTDIHKVEDSRTCLGIADEGKTVILFFAEAENKFKSSGITYDQASFFMQKLGAVDAIHLDGGGSSSLVIRKEKRFLVIVPSISFLGLRKTAVNLGFIYEEVR